MIGQRALIVIALVCGAIAGTIYYNGSQRVTVVVAARALDADKAITPEDVATRELPPDALPVGAVRTADEAIGRVPRAPQWPGQILVGPALGTGAAAFHSGLVPAAGQRAVAIPVVPSQALGGALVPGAHVDVIAVPIVGRAPAGRTTEVVASNATVLDLRGDNGGPLGLPGAGRGAAVAVDRLGSVVVGLPPIDALRIADRITTSTFVLVFIPTRE